MVSVILTATDLTKSFYGAMAVDHDGKGIYSTGLEHGDCMNLGNFTKKTPNLDFFQIHTKNTTVPNTVLKCVTLQQAEIKVGVSLQAVTQQEDFARRLTRGYEGNQCLGNGRRYLTQLRVNLSMKNGPEINRFCYLVGTVTLSVNFLTTN